MKLFSGLCITMRHAKLFSNAKKICGRKLEENVLFTVKQDLIRAPADLKRLVKHVDSLSYVDQPNYAFIEQCLLEIARKYNVPRKMIFYRVFYSNL